MKPTEPFPDQDETETYLASVSDIEPPTRPAPGLDAIADTLRARNMDAGEAVLIALPNSALLLRYFFGVLYAGGVPTLLLPGTPRQRARELAEKFGARLLVVPAGTTAGPGEPVHRAGPVDLVVLREAQPHRYSPGEVILLTSGTSGALSGCLHRAGALLRNARRHASAVGLRPDDTVLVSLPLNFSYALVAQALAALATGARLVVTGPPFSAAGHDAVLTGHRVTSSSLTPHMVRTLLRADWRPPGSLRMITVGGEALPPHLTSRLLDRGPGLELYLTYGLTEAGPRVSTLAAHREPAHRLASVGIPLPGVEVRLRDVDAEGVGELLVASDTLLVRKVGTAEGRPGELFTGPGQIATGDRFSRDGAGYLYLHGRLSDFVVSNGFKVSLASVRRIANALPGVVASATRPYATERGDTHFELDLYLTDPGPEAAQLTERRLLSQLPRSERPGRIRARPAEEAGHK